MSAAKGTKKDHTVLWWIGWIVLTIVSFFVCHWFWTPIIAKHVGSMETAHAPIVWVVAVFGSWMVLLVPLIIVMYNKVDRAYEDTRIQREAELLRKKAALNPVRSAFIPEDDRVLSPGMLQKVKRLPRAIKRGHLVTAVLKDGRRIEHVFIVDKEQVVGVYGLEKAPFSSAAEIVDIEPADLDKLPAFEADRWLRFDGAGQG
jgi:hypothetical protein